MSEYTDAELEMRKEINRLRKVIRQQDDIIKDHDNTITSIYNFVKEQLPIYKLVIDREKDKQRKITLYFTYLGGYNILKEIMNLLNK